MYGRLSFTNDIFTFFYVMYLVLTFDQSLLIYRIYFE